MEINTAVPPLGNNASSSTNEAASKVSSDFETFLKMLTVQLENQDPLSPVSSEDFAVQLATFSGVEQQVQTNDLLKALQSQLAVSGMAQFAGWVGMEARAPVEAYFDGTPITMAPEPDLTSSNANLIVKNQFGNQIQSIPINLSHETIQWAGYVNGSNVPNGLYSFEVESISNGTVTSTKPVEVYTPIVEAREINGTTMLITKGGVEVEASAIVALRDPA